MKKYLLINVLLLLLSGTMFAQERVVSGKVSDSGGAGLPGVNVLVKGTAVGTTTNADGDYRITVNDGSATLVFSFIGYAVQEIQPGSRSTLNITLAEDVQQLGEVVVTALGVARDKKALGYSVTTIEGDNFTQARENSLANALSGRVAGVNVSNIASGPAGSSRVIIRGNKSLQGNNQPLYVVDGIPMDNSGFGQAGVWGGTDEGDGMTSINPDDIESITVLKGGNAAALYGARAANGVINIVTKKGTGRKGIGVEFNSNYVFENVNNLTDWQTDYGSGAMVGATLQERVATKPGDQQQAYDWGSQAWGPKFDGSQVVQFDGVARPYSYVGDNWARYYQTGNSWTNSLALTGGNDNQNFRFGVSDLRSSGIIPNSGFDRLNLSMSTNSKFGQKLTFNSKVLYSHENVQNRPFLSDSPGNAIQGVYKVPGNVNINDYKGDPNKLGAVASGVETPDGKSAGEEYQPANNPWGQNPWWVAYQYINSDVRDRIITSGQLRYDILDFLYIQGRAGMDWYTRRDTNLVPQGTGYERSGSMSEGEDRIREINLEYVLGLDKTFSNFSVNAFFGGNKMHRNSERVSIRTDQGFNVPFFAAISNARNKQWDYGYGESGINSLFGSAEVGYNGYLFLTATGRKDWFSVLNPAVNSKFYPSIGGSFVFTDAFTGVFPAWLTYGKARTSWAQVGNVTIGAYDTNLTYSLNGAPHAGRPMASFSSAMGNAGNLPNAGLVPFTSTEIEFGFDLKFIENRMGLDITYYMQKTTDDILNAGISRASGFSTTSVNLGEMTNKGFEFLLSGTPVRGALTWDVSLNFAKNSNEVVSLIPGNPELAVEEPRTRTVFIKHIEGQPFGVITGQTQLRSPDGQLVFDEETGAPITDGSYQIIGNGVPNFTGGLNNSFSYKNINLSFLLDFRAGGDIYSGTNVSMTGLGFHKQTLQGRAGEAPLTLSGVAQNGTNTDGDPIYVPFTKTYTPGEAQNYWSQLAARAQENFIYDASFVKLRQLTVGYNIPRQILEKTPFQNLSISFVGRNLAILYKNSDNIDPESAYSNTNGGQGLDYFGLPQTRSYGFNLRAGF